ncbi:MAG: SOS response-associated peptidase [Candidatus Merdivicinus sp.]|jgi:putative SOS response-associated peptidase YedK
MCGRYGFSTDAKEARNILRQLGASADPSAVRTGEIFPGDLVPILLAGNGRPRPSVGRWGFPNPYRKGLIINARAETAGEKPLFRSLLVGRRCVVPTTCFYEWTRDAARKKYAFRMENTPLTYLAGLYDTVEGETRFVILTTAANASMEPVHDRMPLVLTQEEGCSWLWDAEAAGRILSQRPEELERTEA